MRDDLIFDMNEMDGTWIPTFEQFKDLLNYLNKEYNVDLSKVNKDDWDSIEDLLTNRRGNIEKHNYNLFHVWVGDDILITIVRKSKDSCAGVIKFNKEEF